MKTRNLFKTLLLGACFVGAGLAWGQEYPQHIRDFLLKAQGNEQTIELKDGRAVTYRELVLMPEKLRKETRGLVVSRGEYVNFQDWVVAAIKVESVPKYESLANKIRTIYRAGERPSLPINVLHEQFQYIKSEREFLMKMALKKRPTYSSNLWPSCPIGQRNWMSAHDHPAQPLAHLPNRRRAHPHCGPAAG